MWKRAVSSLCPASKLVIFLKELLPWGKGGNYAQQDRQTSALLPAKAILHLKLEVGIATYGSIWYK